MRIIHTTLLEYLNESSELIHRHIEKTNPHHGSRDTFQGIPSLKQYDWDTIPSLIYPDDARINKDMLYPASKSDVRRYMNAYKTGSKFPPIVLVERNHKFDIFDGAHRLQALNLNVPILAYVGYERKEH